MIGLLVRLAALLAPLLLARPAAAVDLGMQRNPLPLWKVFDQPVFSLEGSHVELFSILFLFTVTGLVMMVRRRRQLIRHLVQVVSLLLFFYVVFSCLGVFGMIRNLIYGISLIGTVHTESFFWMSLPLCVIAFALSSGPFFCGWICPTGTIQELFTMLREAVTRRRSVEPRPVTLALIGAFFAGFLYLIFEVSEERRLFLEDSALYWAASSFVIVFLVLARAAADVPTRHLRWVSFGSIVLSALFKTVITSPVHFAFVDVFDPASAITTLVLAVASLFIGRAWCRYLCPWGQLMSLVHRRSRLKVRLTGSCNQCGHCTTVCRVGAVEHGKVRTEHCQFCFACVDGCPRGALQVVDVWPGGDAHDTATAPGSERR